MKLAPGPAEWLCERAKCRLTPAALMVAAVDGAGRIRGMLAFDDISRGSCECHLAVETPLALKLLLPSGADFAFNRLGVRVVLGFTPADNTAALKLFKRIGFQEAHRVADGWAPGVPMVLQELRATNCPAWVLPAHRKAA